MKVLQNMKKISKILLVLIFVIILGVQIVNASATLIPQGVNVALENFMECLNEGDEKIYEYIDSSNTKLYSDIQKYLKSMEIKYQIKNIDVENDTYYIETKIAASGIGWNVNGFSTNYEIKEIDNEYKIIQTDLFDVVGTENVFKFILKIFAIVGGVIFGIIAIVVTIVIVIVVKTKKNKKENN